MKKLILTAAIAAFTLGMSSMANAGGPGCKGKGCKCSVNCGDNGCTKSCCSKGDKKSCDKSHCGKDGKCAKGMAAPAPKTTGSQQGTGTQK
ncbi:MAG: hypothetical protein HKL88_08270 [Bacteroidia bacterium]|nr:hypothetical protein [Bacteroidia bacterium]